MNRYPESIDSIDSLIEIYCNGRILDLDDMDDEDDIDNEIVMIYNNGQCKEHHLLKDLNIATSHIFLLQRKVIEFFKNTYDTIPDIQKLTDANQLIELYIYVYGVTHHHELYEFFKKTHTYEDDV